MSDFTDMMFDMLSNNSTLQKKDNPLRIVLDKTLGAYMDNFEIPYEQIFLTSATGGWLDAHGRDYGVLRRIGEDDESYRERIIFEKNDNLTVHYLQTLYNIRLFCFVAGFDATNNDLTSDNEYITGKKMLESDSEDVISILNKKFILGEEWSWIHDNKLINLRDVSFSIFWDDNNDYDGNRPFSVTVYLYNWDDDEEPIAEMTVSETDNWEGVFEDIEMFKPNGELFKFYITTNTVTDYTTKNKGLSIIKEYTPESTELVIVKVWNERESIVDRPDSVVMLLKNNDSIYRRVIVTANEEWTKTVTVPIRLNKQTADYEWNEEPIEHYVPSGIDTVGNVTTIQNTYRRI